MKLDLLAAVAALIALLVIATRTTSNSRALSLTAPGLSGGGSGTDSGDDSGVWAAVFAPFQSVADTINAELSTMDNWEFASRFYPRGIRNNNPGNIRHGDPWRGMADQQADSDFITFRAPEYGIRAMGKLLNNYQSLHGINTIAGIIERWAPEFNDKGERENDTQAYIASVSGQIGIAPDQPISVKDALPLLVPAIIKHENGMQPYSADTIAAGLALV